MEQNRSFLCFLSSGIRCWGEEERERVPVADPNELRTSDLLLGTKLKSASHISTEP